MTGFVSEQVVQETSQNTSSVIKQIEKERNQGKVLYNEVLHLKQRTQDTKIQYVSQNVTTIPRNSCNLKLYNTLKGHQNKVAKVCWSKDSTKVLSASQDGFMIVWDAVTGMKKHAIQLENPWVLTCSYSANEKLLASGGLDNNCTIYKVKADTSNYPVAEEMNGRYPMQGINFYQSIQSIFKGHTAYISECEFIGNDSIVTGSGDMTCALWDLTKGSKSRDFIEHSGDVLCLTTFPQNILSNNLFISGSSDGYAKIWDLRSPGSIQSFAVSNSDVTSVKVFPDGNAFATGSDDGVIRLFDLRSDCELGFYSLSQELKNGQSLPELAVQDESESRSHKLFHQKSPLLHRRNNSSGNWNGNASYDQYSIISNTNSVLENQGIFSLDFGKSGRFLYSCYSEYGCVVWDILKGETVGTIGSEHGNKISRVAVSSDGIGLATCSWDSTIKIWSV
ncbi:STE4 Guanine nucleotide-binding protein subunit beta [Candida maltosa Xu316]|uniref:Guanine nucleotide-binding protein subunit beta, putative n=1 Tax=Candida maltosa (strain Xu316) TaxID=1245528 RepID=M3HT93_CANMX|nr:Guanine nucleotide-binding protein subunit beta, putative [Candida maltosa Xu316]